MDFLNPDTPLGPIVENLKQIRSPSCRMCLQGPPGTGKTSFGHWLSEQLDRPLHTKRASDLVSPFVGMTERFMARAFSDAMNVHAILMIDEVDSFLQRRDRAVRLWEVSAVNEMLSQMESFDGIFVASTNFADHLDEASLRRFDLKIRFDYLTSTQKVQLFTRYCSHLGLERPTHQLLEQTAELHPLTPGDFGNVARQHRFRSFATPTDFLNALEGECAVKASRMGRKLGF